MAETAVGMTQVSGDAATEVVRINEIFHSLQGETDTVGLPTVFVRLSGCPLRCQYCDTAYAFGPGQKYSIERVLAEVGQWQVQHVTVSGGEPLAQRACLTLLRGLCDLGYEVSLETSGALPVAEVDERVRKVLDLKTPGSGEEHRNLWENLDVLTPRDQVKFVICDRRDFDWAIGIIDQYQLCQRAPVLFSPSYDQLPARQLADWVVAAQRPIRFQIQLHKLLWGDIPGV
jgi:7-carboxy-7-deazaguanine synthase